MNKIGVIGENGSVGCFRAVGLEVFPCEDPQEAAKILRKLAEDGYAILYITEPLAKQIPEAIDRYKDLPLPAVITIPDRHGSSGAGMRSVSQAVERAVGADILFGGEK
ncbi:MAG: V-type ATP synthase subunit F [Eubacteriales bacterium]|nr:V-type ATP synthase subunit F [Eubacteriales bacterium]